MNDLGTVTFIESFDLSRQLEIAEDKRSNKRKPKASSPKDDNNDGRKH